jgi:hypothetical protein
MGLHCAGETESGAATSLLPSPSLRSFTTSSLARVKDAQPVLARVRFTATALRAGDRLISRQPGTFAMRQRDNGKPIRDAQHVTGGPGDVGRRGDVFDLDT